MAQDGESSNYLDYKYLKIKLNDNEAALYEDLTDITPESGIRDTKELAHHTLAGNDSATYYLRLWIDEDTPLQNEDETYNTERFFYGKVRVIAGPKVEGDIKYSYMVYNGRIHNNETIPENAKVRNTPEDAMADWEDIIGSPGATKPFYMKFRLKDDNTTEDWHVEFVITEEDANEYDGLTPGKYMLKGGDGGNSYTNNILTISKAIDSSFCTEGVYPEYSVYSCWASFIHVSVYNTGNVTVESSEGQICNIDSTGAFICDWV